MKIDRKYLPSRKIYVLIILAIISTTIISILLYKKKETPAEINSTNLNYISTSTWSKIDTDGDKDGLPDWQEMLYSTDKNKADTDNDGTNDIEEIKNNRDPLKANTSKDLEKPNDLFEKVTIEKYTKETPPTKSLTEIYQATNNISIPTYTSVTTVSDLYFVEAKEENIKDYIRFYYIESEQIALFFEKDIDIIEAKEINEMNFSKLLLLSNLIIKSFKEAHLPKDSEWGLRYHLKIINDLEKMSQIIEDLPSLSKEDGTYNSSLNIYYGIREEIRSIMVILDLTFNIKRTNNQ
jgi:hypothetical protein